MITLSHHEPRFNFLCYQSFKEKEKKKKQNAIAPLFNGEKIPRRVKMAKRKSDKEHFKLNNV